MSECRTTRSPRTFIRRLRDGEIFAAYHPPEYSLFEILTELRSGLAFYFVPVVVRRRGWLRRWEFVVDDERAWTTASSGEFEIIKEDVAPKLAYQLRLAHKRVGGL